MSDDPIIEMLEEVTGISMQDETWSTPDGDYVDWWALILEAPDGKAYIYHIDNYGFRSYLSFLTKEQAQEAWDQLTQELDDEYNELNEEAEEFNEQRWEPVRYHGKEE